LVITPHLIGGHDMNDAALAVPDERFPSPNSPDSGNDMQVWTLCLAWFCSLWDLTEWCRHLHPVPSNRGASSHRGLACVQVVRFPTPASCSTDLHLKSNRRCAFVAGVYESAKKTGNAVPPLNRLRRSLSRPNALASLVSSSQKQLLSPGDVDNASEGEKIIDEFVTFVQGKLEVSPSLRLLREIKAYEPPSHKKQEIKLKSGFDILKRHNIETIRQCRRLNQQVERLNLLYTLFKKEREERKVQLQELSKAWQAALEEKTQARQEQQAQQQEDEDRDEEASTTQLESVLAPLSQPLRQMIAASTLVGLEAATISDEIADQSQEIRVHPLCVEDVEEMVSWMLGEWEKKMKQLAEKRGLVGVDKGVTCELISVLPADDAARARASAADQAKAEQLQAAQENLRREVGEKNAIAFYQMVVDRQHRYQRLSRALAQAQWDWSCVQVMTEYQLLAEQRGSLSLPSAAEVTASMDRLQSEVEQFQSSFHPCASQAEICHRQLHSLLEERSRLIGEESERSAMLIQQIQDDIQFMQLEIESLESTGASMSEEARESALVLRDDMEKKREEEEAIRNKDTNTFHAMERNGQVARCDRDIVEICEKMAALDGNAKTHWGENPWDQELSGLEAQLSYIQASVCALVGGVDPNSTFPISSLLEEALALRFPVTDWKETQYDALTPLMDEQIAMNRALEQDHLRTIEGLLAVEQSLATEQVHSQKLNEDYEALIVESENMRHQLEVSQQQYSDQAILLAESQAKADDWNRECSALKEELETCRSESILSLEKVNCEWRDKLQSESDVMMRQLSEITEKYGLECQERGRLAEELNHSRTIFKETQSSLQQQLDEHQSREGQLRQELDVLREEYNSKAKLLEAADRSMTFHDTQLGKLEQSVLESTERLSQSDAVKKDLQEKCRMAGEEIERLNSSCSHLKICAEAQDLEVRNLNEEIERLKVERDELLHKIESFEAAMKAKEDKCTVLSKEKAQVLVDYDTMVQETSEREKQIERLSLVWEQQFQLLTHLHQKEMDEIQGSGEQKKERVRSQAACVDVGIQSEEDPHLSQQMALHQAAVQALVQAERQCAVQTETIAQLKHALDQQSQARNVETANYLPISGAFKTAVETLRSSVVDATVFLQPLTSPKTDCMLQRSKLQGAPNAENLVYLCLTAQKRFTSLLHHLKDSHHKYERLAVAEHQSVQEIARLQAVLAEHEATIKSSREEALDILHSLRVLDAQRASDFDPVGAGKVISPSKRSTYEYALERIRFLEKELQQHKTHLSFEIQNKKKLQELQSPRNYLT
jgi:hypothetical protein